MLDLLDYRQRVAALYRDVREAAENDPAEQCARFRAERDRLFRSHPQSALDEAQRARFTGLAYYDYDPAYRCAAQVEPVEPREYMADLGEEGTLAYRRIGRAAVTLPGGQVSLAVYWLLGYGGGVFLPFKDATSGSATYGGGRYLLDTIKGADLGVMANA